MAMEEVVIDDLSRFRAVAWASAYTVGWQLYIEKEMK